MRLPGRILLHSTLLLFSASSGWLALAGMTALVTGCAQKEEEAKAEEEQKDPSQDAAASDGTEIVPFAEGAVSTEGVTDENLTTEWPQELVDISGTWKCCADWVYTISQNGNNFTWTNTKLNETAEGTIDGSRVSAKWTGSYSNASATGDVALGPDGRAIAISWSNGIVFTR